MVCPGTICVPIHQAPTPEFWTEVSLLELWDILLQEERSRLSNFKKCDGMEAVKPRKKPRKKAKEAVSESPERNEVAEDLEGVKGFREKVFIVRCCGKLLC